MSTTFIAPTNNNLPEAPQPRKIDLLTGMLSEGSVVKQFENALAKNAPTFIASIIDLFNTDSAIQQCSPKELVMEALKAAVLKLPINKSLGYAYIIPYNKNYKAVNPKTGAQEWRQKMVPTFQMGYKGYIQLAMRTGQYLTINADVVYEGEFRKKEKISGRYDLDGVKTSETIVGYFAHFELLNGFQKTLYMDVSDMARHAKRYSKSIKKTLSVDDLIAIANMKAPETNIVGWENNFTGMAVKTMLRNLLSKYGYLSIEMQEAIQNDSDIDVVIPDDTDMSGSQTFDVSDTTYEDVTDTEAVTNNQSKPDEVDPGY